MALTSHDEIPTDVLDGAVKPYSRDKVYVLTALFLAAITVVEVLTYTMPDFPLWSHDNNMIIPALMIMMAVKFFTVAYIFMHLKFDKPILTWVFYSGLVLAVLVYIAVLSAFRIWWPGEHT
jgi:cytochrome c oxidase subunit 4